MLEDALDARRLQDRRDDLPLAASVPAVFDADLEHALEQSQPAEGPAWSPVARLPGKADKNRFRLMGRGRTDSAEQRADRVAWG